MQKTATRGYTIDVTETGESDWDQYAPEVLVDQIAAYDRMRRQCPVAHDVSGNWAVVKHAGVVRVLDEHQTFSNVFSSHVAVPNGMDPPTAHRFPGDCGPLFRGGQDDRVRTGGMRDRRRNDGVNSRVARKSSAIQTFRFEPRHSPQPALRQGVPVCPGEPLARLELRVFVEQLFADTADHRAGSRRVRDECGLSRIGFRDAPPAVRIAPPREADRIEFEGALQGGRTLARAER